MVAASPPTHAYPAYVGASSAWMCAWGMQGVLFAWMVTHDLNAPAEQLGVAQLALLAPALVALSIGGLVADHVDRRRLLVALFLITGLGMIALAWAVDAGWLSMALLIGYALAMGSLSGFSTPARDAMLSQVAGTNMFRAVAGLTIAQFIAQGLGQYAAGVAEFIGTPAALCVQATILLAGVLGLWILGPARPSAEPGSRPGMRESFGGVVEVFHSPTLRPVMILSIAIGLFFFGSYTVLFPLLIRDIYAGDVADLGLLTAMFPVGCVFGSVIVLARGGIRRRGTALVLAQGAGGAALIGMGMGVSYEMSLALGIVWGLAGAVFMNTSRTVFQESATREQLARVLSVYSLGFMGAGALGTLAAGFIAGALGTLGALRFNGCAMLAFVAAMVVFTRVTSLRAPGPAQGS